jgi:hypothetical protein
MNGHKAREAARQAIAGRAATDEDDAGWKESILRQCCLPSEKCWGDVGAVELASGSGTMAPLANRRRAKAHAPMRGEAMCRASFVVSSQNSQPRSSCAGLFWSGIQSSIFRAARNHERTVFH